MVRTTAEGRRNRVRVARLTQELTQAQLAKAVDVSRQTVVAIEAGDYAPSVYLALRIAGVLGESVEALFASDGNASDGNASDGNTSDGNTSDTGAGAERAVHDGSEGASR